MKLSKDEILTLELELNKIGRYIGQRSIKILYDVFIDDMKHGYGKDLSRKSVFQNSNEFIKWYKQHAGLEHATFVGWYN